MAKLYGGFPVPHVRGEQAHLARALGRREPRRPACRDAALLSSAPPEREPARGQFIAARRYRRRFDALLQSPLSALEPHLWWALARMREAVGQKQVQGIDWVRLLDDLRLWVRGPDRQDKDEHRRKRDICDIWAEEYLNSVG